MLDNILYFAVSLNEIVGKLYCGMLCYSTITMGTCVEAQGTLVNTSKPKQPVEVQAHSLHVFGPCDPIVSALKT